MSALATAVARSKCLFRIQYVSDLHLEFYDKLAFPLILTPAARYLALAGDIGHPDTDLFKSFIDYTARNWDRVFFVAGNHEYYTRKPAQSWKHTIPAHMFETQDALKAIFARYKNVTYLHHDNPSVYLAGENVAIVGSTLWSHIPRESMYLSHAMNDYKYIPFESEGTVRPLLPEDVNQLHTKEREMLEAQIDYWGSQKAQVVVITHHMPSFSLISPKYENSPYNMMFASHCEALMKPHVRSWIYGHTHNAGVASFKHTLCAVNARGYPHESAIGFSKEAWLEFPIKHNDELTECGCDELAAAAAGIRSPYLKVGAAKEDVEFM